MADFLLEIGTEEIPARMIDAATDELSRRVRELVERERLSTETKVESFSTPRRIAVLARGINASQPDLEEEVLGPSLKVAYKDGEYGPAAHAFAKKVNVDLAALRQVNTPKGDYLAATVLKKGRPAAELLAESLPKEIASIYWAKNMYWRGKNAERFVRPLRWLVAMLDGEVVPVEFAGIAAGKQSRGHRIMAKSDVTISSPSSYAEAVASASVVATSAEREHRIRKALDAATRTVPGARWREDAGLLETVVNLTEYPSAILGNFEPEYLTLPEEVLVTVMRDHQKYFAVEDAQGKLAPHFLAVLNTAGDPAGLIRHGNERVLRARFNDARFFWNADQKTPLRDRVESLKSVTFQKELGSYHAKTMRIWKLANAIADELSRSGVTLDREALQEAALLSKTDLTTELVKEFTELQGIIGGLYAKEQGHGAAVGDAIYDQYKPESMEDDIPRTIEGAVLAIADKADSIAGMFANGHIPSGSKDPFALRRAANGIVRILAEKKLPLSQTALWVSHSAFGAPTKALGEFLNERYAFYLRDARGFAYDVVSAVLAAGADDVVDAVKRAEAVSKVRPSEDFESISIAFKRMKNILRQAAEAGKWNDMMIQAAFPHSYDEPAEGELFAIVPQLAATVGGLRAEKKYEEALAEISKLRKPLDTFFDKVMVMVDDQQVRQRRLYLLHKLLSEFSTIADFSEIVAERKA